MTKKDELLVGPPSPNGFYCIRYTDKGREVGTISPAQEGKPLAGAKLMHITHKGPGPLYEVEDLYDGTTTADKAGPAKVSSKAYLTGWDRIFGKGPKSEELN